MILLFGHLSVSLATEIDIDLVDDGSVKVSCLVEAPFQEVRGAIADPLVMMDFSEGLKIVQKERIDQCRIVDYQTAWSSYKVKMCPVDSGFNFDLISSATLSAFWTRWRFTQVDGGVRVDYQIRVKPKIPIPQKIMQQRLKKDVIVFFTEFKDYLE